MLRDRPIGCMNCGESNRKEPSEVMLTKLIFTEQHRKDIPILGCSSLPHSLGARASLQATSRASGAFRSTTRTVLARRPLMSSKQLADETLLLDRLCFVVGDPEAVGAESGVGIRLSDGGGATAASEFARGRGSASGGRDVVAAVLGGGRLVARVGRGGRVLGRVRGIYSQ